MKIVNTKCLLLVDQNKCSRLASDVYEYSLIIPELASETYHHIELEFGGYFFRWVSFELPLTPWGVSTMQTIRALSIVFSPRL